MACSAVPCPAASMHVALPARCIAPGASKPWCCFPRQAGCQPPRCFWHGNKQELMPGVRRCGGCYSGQWAPERKASPTPNLTTLQLPGSTAPPPTCSAGSHPYRSPGLPCPPEHRLPRCNEHQLPMAGGSPPLLPAPSPGAPPPPHPAYSPQQLYLLFDSSGKQKPPI